MGVDIIYTLFDGKEMILLVDIDVRIEIPNQEEKRCELCGRTHEKELIHILHLEGKIAKKKIDMCDVCIATLRDKIEGY